MMCATLLAASLSAAALADPPAAPRATPGREAALYFEVTASVASNHTAADSYFYDPSPNADIVGPLVERRAIEALDNADTQKLLGIPQGALARYVHLSFLRFNAVQGPAGVPRIQGVLVVNIKLDARAPAVAQALASKIAQRLPEILASLNPTGDQIKSTRSDIDSSERKLAEVRAQIGQSEAEFHSKYGLADLSTQDLHDLTHKLDETLVQSRIDGAAQTARRDAIISAVAKLTRQAQSQVKDDQIAQELQAIVALRKTRSDDLNQLSKVGTATPTDVQQAQVEFAQANVQLLERQEAVAHAVGGDALTDLQRQLSQIEIDLAESNARQAAVAAQAQNLAGAAQIAQHVFDLTNGDLATLQSQLSQQKSGLEQMQQQLSGETPLVYPCDENGKPTTQPAP